MFCLFISFSLNNCADLNYSYFRCSRLVVNNDSIEIERFIVVGAAPLLSHLLEDRYFMDVSDTI